MVLAIQSHPFTLLETLTRLGLRHIFLGRRKLGEDRLVGNID